jgi:hypothetical protein
MNYQYLVKGILNNLHLEHQVRKIRKSYLKDKNLITMIILNLRDLIYLIKILMKFRI